MIISVASGKGGTGKTSIAVSLALSSGADAFFDCDVEGPNAAIFLNPQISSKERVFMHKPVFELEKCVLCGRCADACNFGAIAITRKKLLFFSELCHGCGFCKAVCGYDVISEEEFAIGEVEEGICKNGMRFFAGRLFPGESLSPLVIRRLKADIEKDKLNILDVPAGNACPMREAVRGSDFSLLVSEPTPFGLHDLKIAVSALRSMGIPFAVIENKAQEGVDIIDAFCQDEGIELLLKIPFDRELAHAYSMGHALVDAYPKLKADFISVIKKIEESV